MKRSVLLLVSAAMLPSAALAGPVDVAPIQPPVVVAPEVTWDGFYVGLGASMTTGDIDFFTPDVPQALDDGEMFSVFAGYRMQSGNLVYGGELAVSMVDEIAVTGFTGVSALDGTFLDARATLGYAFGSVMVYGAAGYSTGTYNNIIGTAGNEWDLTGFNYGIGAEYQISDAFSVGLDYTARDLEGDDPLGSAQTVEVDLDSITLRAMFRF